MEGAELESLVIRLIGDVSQYMKAMDSAVKHTEHAAEKIEHAAEHIEKFHQKLGEFAEKAEKSLLKVGVAIGTWEAFEKADEAEANMRHLEAMIELNGKSIEHTREEYEKFAKEMSKTTMLSKGETLAILQKAEAYRLTSEATQKITRDAIALSNIPGVMAGPEGLLRVASEMEKGNSEGAMEMSRRMLPMMKSVKDAKEFAEEYNKLVKAGLKIAGDDADDATGKLTKMKQALGGVTKAIGENLKPAIDEIIEKLTGFTAWLIKTDSTKRTLIVTILTGVAAVGTLAASWGTLTLVGGRLLTVVTVIGTNLTILTTAAIIQAAAALSSMAVGFMTAGAAATLFNIAVMAAPYVMIAAGLVLVINLILRYRDAQKALTATIEEGVKLTEKSMEMNQKRFEKDKNATDVSPEEILKSYTNTLKGQRDLIKQIEKEQRDNSGKGDTDEIESRLKDAQKRAEQTAKFVEELKNRTEGKLSEKTTGDIKSMTNSLREKINTSGLSELEKQRYDLGKDLTESQREVLEIALKEVDALIKVSEQQDLLKKGQEDAAEETKKHEEALKSLIETMEQDYFKSGLSEEQMLDYTLSLHGASDAVREYAHLLKNMKDEQDYYNKLVKEADQILDEAKTPFEKFAETIEKLNEMLELGIITQEEYGIAAEYAEGKLDKVGQAAKEASDKIRDAAKAGSQEALSRIDAYQDMLRMPILGTDGASTRGGVTRGIGDQFLQGGASGGASSSNPQEKTDGILIGIRDRLQTLIDNGGILATPGV